MSAFEQSDMIENVDGECENDKNFYDDGDWRREAGDALNAPAKQTDNDQKNNESYEKI